LFWLLWIRKYDLIVSHRECIPVGPVLFERLASWQRPFVLIYDDALFIVKSSTTNKLFDWFKSAKRYPAILKLADLTIGTNDYLAAMATELGGNGKALKIGEDLSRYTVRKTNANDSIALGWVGSPSTEKYLELIRSPLESIGQQFPNTKLIVVGGGKFQLDHLSVEHRPWQVETELQNLQDIDIGLMPLPQDDWSLGKSGGKARLYMAVGIAPVVSKIGFNEQLIDDRQQGRLIDSADQWVPALQELLTDHKLRHSLAANARQRIEEEYSIDITGEHYLDLLMSVLPQKATR